MTQQAQAEALANLRHLYQQMVNGAVKDSTQAKRIAEGLLSRAIAQLEAQLATFATEVATLPHELATQQAVQMPEPELIAYRGIEPVNFYTEQQVRAMVAAGAVQGYDSGIQTGSRITLSFNTQEDATRWFEGFADAYDAAHGTKSITLPIPLAAAPTPLALERKS